MVNFTNYFCDAANLVTSNPVLVAAVAGSALVAVAPASAIGVVLTPLGFGPGGVVAGSWAASVQGAAVQAGSYFATAQSAAMGGASAGTVGNAAGMTAAGAAGAGIAKACGKNND